MKAFALYDLTHQQIVTDDNGQLMIYTSQEYAGEQRISGEVIREVKVTLLSEKPNDRTSNS